LFFLQNLAIEKKKKKKKENARLTRHRKWMLLHEKRKRGRMSNYNSIQTIVSTGESMRE
jgi:hypothetical protein